jgi:hypothetical protein
MFSLAPGQSLFFVPNLLPTPVDIEITLLASSHNAKASLGLLP